MSEKAVSDRVYRLDKFLVPNAAREEFLKNVNHTHALLKSQPGYLQGFILEQPVNADEFNLVTLIEWENSQSAESARFVVQAMHKETGFNPQEVRARLGIKFELGDYRTLGV